MNNMDRIQYGQSLYTMGFNYHNTIRFYRDSGNNKVYPLQLDYYMKNLSKRSDIEYLWACIEPDIDKLTSYIYKYSNNVHFAWKSSKTLTNHQLANYLRINRSYIGETREITNSMEYFSKHIGKSLSYHNFY